MNHFGSGLGRIERQGRIYKQEKKRSSPPRNLVEDSCHQESIAFSTFNNCLRSFTIPDVNPTISGIKLLTLLTEKGHVLSPFCNSSRSWLSYEIIILSTVSV